jgi:hypothetical protein
MSRSRSRFRSFHKAPRAAACLAWCVLPVSGAPLLNTSFTDADSNCSDSKSRRTPAGVALDHPSPVRCAQVAVTRFQVAGVAEADTSLGRCRSHAPRMRRAHVRLMCALTGRLATLAHVLKWVRSSTSMRSRGGGKGAFARRSSRAARRV